MSNRGFRRWVGLGALASAVLLGGACSRGGEGQLPEREGQPGGRPTTGGQFEGRANESQDLESFGQEQQPATGGSGQQLGQPQQQTQPLDQQPMSPDEAQQLGPEEAAGAQGRQGGIAAPGYSTPQETGSPGTGVTGGSTTQMDGTSAPGIRTESGGMRPGAPPPSDAPDSSSQPSRDQ